MAGSRRSRLRLRKHSLYFGLGLFAIWVALESPIDTIADQYLDSVHMLQHVLLGFVAPPLMLLGLSRGMVATVVRVPGVRALIEPVPAQLIAGAVMIGWHIPVLYDATLYSEPLHVTEHLTFIAAGLLLYWPMLEATSAYSQWSLSPVAKLIYMLAATLPQDAVALALIFSRVPFYEYYVHALPIGGVADAGRRPDGCQRRTDDLRQSDHYDRRTCRFLPLVQQRAGG